MTLPDDDACGDVYTVPDSWEAFDVTCALPNGHADPYHQDASGAFRWKDEGP